MYYYTNTASSIRRELTRRLSFIILAFWRAKMLYSILEGPNFQNFLGHALRPLVLACFACKCALHTIEICISFKTS